MAISGKPKGKKSRIPGAVLGEIAGAVFGATGTGAAAGLRKSPADNAQTTDPAPENSATPTRSARTNPSNPDRPPGTQQPKKRKLGWRGFMVLLIAAGFFIASAVIVAGGLSMGARGIGGDDLSFVWTIAGLSGLVGVVLVVLAFRRRAYVDESGAIIAFAVMAEMIGGEGSAADGEDGPE